MTSVLSPSRHIVTMPLASERPYAVITVAMRSSERSRSTSWSGTTAAPVTTSRSALRSCWSRAGWSSRDWWRVGGPGSTEMRSAVTLARTVSMLKTGCGTIVAPRIRQAMMPAL